MNILQSNIHRAHGYREIFESGEEIEEVVRGQGKFSGFDSLRGEFQGTKWQGCCQSRWGRARRRARLSGRIFARLTFQLKRVGECLLMGSYKTGEILHNSPELVDKEASLLTSYDKEWTKFVSRKGYEPLWKAVHLHCSASPLRTMPRPTRHDHVRRILKRSAHQLLAVFKPEVDILLTTRESETREDLLRQGK